MLGDGAGLAEGAALEEGDGREFAPLDADDEDFVPPDAAEPEPPAVPPDAHPARTRADTTAAAARPARSVRLLWCIPLPS